MKGSTNKRKKIKGDKSQQTLIVNTKIDTLRIRKLLSGNCENIRSIFREHSCCKHEIINYGFKFVL